MCGGEVLLLQGLDQVWAVLGVNTPERTFSTGLVDRAECQPVSHMAPRSQCNGAEPARREKQQKPLCAQKWIASAY